MWGEVTTISMIAATSSLGHDNKVMEESDVKIPERKYIIPPDDDSDEEDNDAEEITLSEMEVDDEEAEADEEAAGRGEEQNGDENEGEIENMELLEVSTEGGREEGDLGSDQGYFEPDEVLEVELLEVSKEEVDLGRDKGDCLEGEFDPDEDMEETLVIDEEEEEKEVGGEKMKLAGSAEWKDLELLPAGWKFKEAPRHDGGKKVFYFPQYLSKLWLLPQNFLSP